MLTEQLLTEVAVAREALEKADASYNTALYKLEVRTAADLFQMFPGNWNVAHSAWLHVKQCATWQCRIGIMLWQGLQGSSSTVHVLPWHKPVAEVIVFPPVACIPQQRLQEHMLC